VFYYVVSAKEELYSLQDKLARDRLHECALKMLRAIMESCRSLPTSSSGENDSTYVFLSDTAVKLVEWLSSEGEIIDLLNKVVKRVLETPQTQSSIINLLSISWIDSLNNSLNRQKVLLDFKTFE
jgi:hypothetical protein